MLWKHRGILTSIEQPSKKNQYVLDLLEDIKKPKLLSTIKISGHSKLNSEESKENKLADTAARAATVRICSTLRKTSVLITKPSISMQDLLAETPKLYFRRNRTNCYITVVNSGKS